ncbi:MAG: amidinotransferase [Acidobacteriia bacterium]|nr:amidinotransferase [Terriglobia bacterium]
MDIVSSWNEWDPLREVVVGSARGAADTGYEPALSPYFAPGSQGRLYRGGPVPAAVIADAERQLDHFADVLVRRGITVRRPDPVDQCIPVKTPDWEVAGGHATACPRDILLVVGNEIIEAPMAQRARYFEFRAYRSLLADYFRHGARWTAAPKPLMRDKLYIEKETGDQEPFDFTSGPLLAESEPVFDAACFTRCGRDIFWQPDLVSNQTGADWLGRHLGPGFRIHRMEFAEPTPTHIDTTLVPVRPGLVLVNPVRPCTNGGMQLFKDNGWRVVQAPASVRTGRSPARDVSNWISMNILMLDENTVVVEQAETPMIELMRSLGCEVVTCPFDRVYPFGGGFHCCTADIRREGTLRSYFPALDAKSGGLD